jgi:hypothetical protein
VIPTLSPKADCKTWKNYMKKYTKTWEKDISPMTTAINTLTKKFRRPFKQVIWAISLNIKQDTSSTTKYLRK